MEKRVAKIFTYAVAESENYSDTRAIVEQKLNCKEVVRLSCGNFFGSTDSRQLRSGSIIILYADSSEELTTLSNQARDFAHYNLILIINKAITSPYKNALQLVPRHINVGSPVILELQDIISKIEKKVSETNNICRHDSGITTPHINNRKG